jgi:hypothetical protein
VDRDSGMSDRACRIADYSRTGRHITCDDCAGADDGTIPHADARKENRAAPDPYLLADVHRQSPLQVAAPFVKPMGMVGTIDMHTGSQHRPPADPNGRRVEDNTTRIYVYLVAKYEIPDVGDVEWSLKEYLFTDSRKERRELWCAGTAKSRVHVGVTPACMSRNNAQCLKFWRDARIPTSVGHFGQRCWWRLDSWSPCAHVGSLGTMAQYKQ